MKLISHIGYHRSEIKVVDAAFGSYLEYLKPEFEVVTNIFRLYEKSISESIRSQRASGRGWATLRNVAPRRSAGALVNATSAASGASRTTLAAIVTAQSASAHGGSSGWKLNTGSVDD